MAPPLNCNDWHGKAVLSISSFAYSAFIQDDHLQFGLSGALVVPVLQLFHTNADLPLIYEVGDVDSELQRVAVYGTYFWLNNS